MANTAANKIATLRTEALSLTRQAIEAGAAIWSLPPTAAAMLRGLAFLHDFAGMSVAVQQVLDTCEMAPQEREAFQAVAMLAMPYGGLAIDEKRLADELARITDEAEQADYLASTREHDILPLGAVLSRYNLAIERARQALALMGQEADAQ
jgi:hypothetical protein